MRPMVANSHGTSKYRDGCRCQVCRAAMAEAKRRSRARRPDAVGKPNVVGLPSNPQPVEANGMGDNERGVRAQCANSKLGDDKPGIVSQAIYVGENP
jgi:hypothetical protein